MAELDFEVTDEVDITDKVCPLTFVKAKVAIEELEDGEVLAVRMNDGEPVQNVPRSMKEEGHKILKLEDNADESLPVLVDFYSDSCVACKKLAPVLGNAEDDYEDKVKVYKVNTNFDVELAEQYEVQSNPTLILFKDGQVKDRKVGAMKQADLNSWIEEQI